MKLSSKLAYRASQGKPIDCNSLMAIAQQVADLENTLQEVCAQLDIVVSSNPQAAAEAMLDPSLKAIYDEANRILDIKEAAHGNL